MGFWELVGVGIVVSLVVAVITFVLGSPRIKALYRQKLPTVFRLLGYEKDGPSGTLATGASEKLHVTDQWLKFSARWTLIKRARDKGYKFFLLRIPRATLANLTTNAAEIELYATWESPGGAPLRGQAANEASAGILRIEAESVIQVRDLQYILPESKWDDVAGPDGDLDDLTVNLVAKDYLSERTQSWELGQAARNGQTEFPLAPLNLGIETGHTYLKEISHDEYQYALLVSNCILTNRTDKPMNLSGWLLMQFEGIGGILQTDLLTGLGDIPKLPFTIGANDSWGGDLAFGVKLKTPWADRPKTIGENFVRATLEFRDHQSPGRYATQGAAFRLPPSTMPPDPHAEGDESRSDE